jgi:uncharacterized RDD family membrane protein YckC
MLAIAVLITLPNALSMLSPSGIFRLDINLIVFLTLALLWGYSTLLEGFAGQSLGKRIVGLRVIRIDGKKLSYDYAVVRNFDKAFLLPFDLIIGLRLKDERASEIHKIFRQVCWHNSNRPETIDFQPFRCQFAFSNLVNLNSHFSNKS